MIDTVGLQVRLYSVNSQGQSEPKAMYSHEGPVLDLTWVNVCPPSLSSSRMLSGVERDPGGLIGM